MTSNQPNIDNLLPFGESLRAFVEQPFIKKGDLVNFLRLKGIFVGDSSKERTVPIAVCCLPSPSEFDTLKEAQNHREDNPKTINKFFPWNSDKTLLDSLPEKLDLSSLLGEGLRYCKVIGEPGFVPIGSDPNRLILNYEMERQDFSKSWAATINIFKGSLTAEKVFEGKSVRLVLTHTAAETRHLNQQLSVHVKAHFEDIGCVPKMSSHSQIVFSEFNNAQRVKFFFALTETSSTKLLDFNTVSDLGVCPDKRSGNLPGEMQWMEKHVSDLKLKGTDLHQTFFIKDARYHDFVCIYRMDAKFDFSYHAAAGSCTISFEFTDFDAENIGAFEFETNISGLTLDDQFSGANKMSVKEHLLRTIQFFAYDQYQMIVDPKP